MARVQLQIARYRRGWTQEEAAGQVGVTRSTYQHWEAGKTIPYPIHMYRLCEVFQSSVETLELTVRSSAK
jgi:transcriptional regulator with XRE-family HTH domain